MGPLCTKNSQTPPCAILRGHGMRREEKAARRWGGLGGYTSLPATLRGAPLQWWGIISQLSSKRSHAIWSPDLSPAIFRALPFTPRHLLGPCRRLLSGRKRIGPVRPHRGRRQLRGRKGSSSGRFGVPSRSSLERRQRIRGGRWIRFGTLRPDRRLPLRRPHGDRKSVV